MKWTYFILCVLGTALPLSQFVPWISDHGITVPLMFQEALSTQISAFAWLDVLVSAVVVLVLIIVEGRRLRMKHLWAPFLALVTVGVSLSLPLFLLLRELHISSTRF